MKIAVEGCCHGELEKIYETLEYLQQKDQMKIDLLLICGDFQAVRNMSDLKAMAVPPKFQSLQTFYKYYSGEKKAPIMTIVIGGNHEASNYLQELPYGGWLAPNIYYLGYAGVVQFGGIRVGGLSGIYKPREYTRGHYEHPPYNDDTKRSCYHIRNFEVFRLKQLKQPIDMFLSHDWPAGIHSYGDCEALLRRKPFFRADIESGNLGSPPAADLLHCLQPDYWFAAHLHVKFAAVVGHSDGAKTKTTKFLALDKCLPRRQFLQVLDVVPRITGQPLELHLDPEWLCILRSTNHLMRLTRAPCYMPGPGCSERYDFSVLDNDLLSLSEDFGGVFKVPNNFVQTAPPHTAPCTPSGGRGGRQSTGAMVPEPQICINPQTTLLCDMLSLTDPYAVFSGRGSGSANFDAALAQDESDSLDVDDRDEGCVDDSDFINDSTMDGVAAALATSFNPDEISIDDVDDDDDVVNVGPVGDEAGASSHNAAISSEGKFFDGLRANILSATVNSVTVEEKISTLSGCEINPGDCSTSSGQNWTKMSLPALHDEPEVIKPGDNVKSGDSMESCDVPVVTKRSATDVQTENHDKDLPAAESIPVIKKLKRRNMALYCTETNDD